MPTRIRNSLVVAACALSFTRAAAAQNVPPVQLEPPGATGRRITEDGLLSQITTRQRARPRLSSCSAAPLEGCRGRPTTSPGRCRRRASPFGTSRTFADRGQNPRLELIPLEYFDTALAWLRRQPEADPARTAIAGVSKGAEAALLVAVRHSELKAVVAALPSSVVWPGIVWEGSTGPIGSSWTEHGKPLPHVPHAPYDAGKGGTMAANFAKSLEALPQHPEAIVPVERIAAPILLVCGEKDDISPSCPMARQIQDRLREHRKPEATLLVYTNAGHRAFGPPLSLTDPRFDNALNAVLEDSWKHSLAFLRAALSFQRRP